MQSFLSIFVLFVSFQALSDSSCKDQKKLLKSTCSFKGDKIKTKNLNRANSCKKIKDLFLELKMKTKENYKSCKEAYEECTEKCTQCNKSQVNQFKEKSKKKLKKFKKGLKKASKCLSQLSSDFEEKKEKESFSTNPYTKEFLKYLKSEKLKEKKKKEIEHQKFLKEKEKIEFGKKLGNKFRQIDKRLKLNQWARKHQIRTYGKSTKELKQLKIDYEVAKIKKQGRIERLKLQTQRKERLKKKFEAEVLKANPPQTKLDMAFQSVTEVFSSYWKKAKDYFERVFFGEFASAQGGYSCKFMDDIFSDIKVFRELQEFIVSDKYQKQTDSSNLFKKLKEQDIFKLLYNCDVINNFLDNHDSIKKEDFKPDPEPVEREKKEKELKLAKKVLKVIKILDIAYHIYKTYKRISSHTTFNLCLNFGPSLEEMKEKYKKGIFESKDLIKFLHEAQDSNVYHIVAYFYYFRSYQDHPSLPQAVRDFMSQYFQSIEDPNSKENLFAVPFIVFYLMKDTDAGHVNAKNTVYEFDENANPIKDKTGQFIKKDYHTALNAAIESLVQSSKDKNATAYVKFYERYIASLIYIARADYKEKYIYYDKYPYNIIDEDKPIWELGKRRLKEATSTSPLPDNGVDAINRTIDCIPSN